jgi:hypothetical protein
MKTNTHTAQQLQALDHLHALRHFISRPQAACLAELLRGEEGEHFAATLARLVDITQNQMPEPYATDGQGAAARVHLHYFTGSCDWWITERDSTAEQHQAFGLASLGYDSELGYISIAEIIAAGAELDLYWKPATLADCQPTAAAA